MSITWHSRFTFAILQSTQWNVTVERQFGDSWTGRISYIGYNSYRLPRHDGPEFCSCEQNALSSCEGALPAVGPDPPAWKLGVRQLPGLELQATHRMASGFYLQATYDWAKDLTNANSDAPTAFGNEQGNLQDPTVLRGVNDRFNLRNDQGQRRRSASQPLSVERTVSTAVRARQGISFQLQPFRGRTCWADGK